jgi:hypothetical protein
VIRLFFFFFEGGGGGGGCLSFFLGCLVAPFLFFFSRVGDFSHDHDCARHGGGERRSNKEV